VPVLAHDSGAISEVIVEGRNGFLLRSGSAGEIAGRVIELIDNRDALRQAAAAARRLWQEHFTAARFRSEICQLLQKLTRTARVRR
jgi:glycosyltransferase involved in cell wall biosynthesis